MATRSIAADPLAAAACRAGEVLRGVVEPGAWKDYVWGLFFLRYLSDGARAESARLLAEHVDHPELAVELMKYRRFRLPPGADFHALHEARHEPGNGERIDRALRAIEDANLSKLRDVFQDFCFNSVVAGNEVHKNDCLRRLLEAFASPELDLDPPAVSPEAVAQAADALVTRFSGAASTPPAVARLMARLTQPQPGDHICDPTCGFGNLLLQAARCIRQEAGVRHYALFGQEAVGNTWAWARLNLLLHDEDNHRIEWGDTLGHPKHLDGRRGLRRFDIVLAHLPFSVADWAYEQLQNDRFKRFGRGLPPRTRADYAFILHMIETLKPETGRMAVLVPHGVLFRGAAERRIRRQLIEENLLDAVIGLPPKLLRGKGIPTVLLVLRKSKTDDQVLFVDASRDGQAGKRQNLLRPQDVDRIEQVVRARRSVTRYAHLASPQELAANDFNLNITRYVDASEPAPAIDLATVRAERSRLWADLNLVEEKMAEILKELGDE